MGKIRTKHQPKKGKKKKKGMWERQQYGLPIHCDYKVYLLHANYSPSAFLNEGLMGGEVTCALLQILKGEKIGRNCI